MFRERSVARKIIHHREGSPYVHVHADTSTVVRELPFLRIVRSLCIRKISTVILEKIF